MGKKLNEKITIEHKVNIEGLLNVDNLCDDMILCDVEEIGEVDLKKFLDKFNGKNIKIILGEKTEEIPEE